MNQNLIVHIDMKGGPPSLDYLIGLLPLFKKWGATGLLVEWEDMFPWQGELEILSRSDAYTRADVESLLAAAVDSQLQVIPLVQTFGHLEFVLKHDKFRVLREVGEFPNSLRPVEDEQGREGEGLRLVCEMVKQVAGLHGRSMEAIHIGCDEVWCLGQGQVTRSALEALGLGVVDVFVRHVSKVAEFARQLPSSPEVLVWDDMLRDAEVGKLKELAGLVQPVVWSYLPKLQFPEGMWGRYQEAWGTNIWGGSAWRGATGSCALVTPVSYHLENHNAWKNLDVPLKGETSS